MQIYSQFPNNIEAKIGLQYVHDFLYTYPGGDPGYANTAVNAWISSHKDRYNKDLNEEWLMSKDVIDGSSTFAEAWSLQSSGQLVDFNQLSSDYGVRPVFYLKPDVKLSAATGWPEDPFIITNVNTD